MAQKIPFKMACDVWNSTQQSGNYNYTLTGFGNVSGVYHCTQRQLTINTNSTQTQHGNTFFDGRYRASTGFYITHAQTTTDPTHMHINNYYHANAATSSIAKRWDVVATVTDGFEVDPGLATNYAQEHMLFSGAKHISMKPINLPASGTFDVDFGHAPHLVFLMSTALTATQRDPWTDRELFYDLNDGEHMLGIVHYDGTTVDQVAYGLTYKYNVTTTNVQAGFWDTACLIRGSGSHRVSASVPSANTLRLTADDPGLSDTSVWLLAIELDDPDCVALVVDTAPGSATTKKTTLPWEPDGLFILATTRTTKNDNSAAIASRGFSQGIYDGTRHGCAGVVCGHGLTSSVQYDWLRNDSIIWLRDQDAAVYQYCTVSSLDSDGFTLDWTVNDESLYFAALAFRGNKPATLSAPSFSNVGATTVDISSTATF